MKKLLFVALLVLVAAAAGGQSASAQERQEQFRTPDVRNDYCGIEIGFQFCQCAFHDVEGHCRSIQMDQSAARSHVTAGFKEWVAGLIETFAANCLRNGGQWDRNRRTCTYPDPGEPPQSVQERYRLPDMTGKPRSANSGRAIGKVAVVTDCNVFVYMASFNRWKGPVRSGQDLYQDDVLLTRDQDGCVGEAKITIYSRTGEDTINIAPETWFEFSPPADESSEGFFGYLRSGAIFVYDALTGNLQPEFRSPFNVRTPTVATGRRGTEYVIAHDEESGVTRVLVMEGEVYVTPNGGESILAAAGQQISHDGAEPEISPLSTSDWSDGLRSHRLSADRSPVDPSYRVAPAGPPVEYTRAELVGDLSFLDDQFGGAGFPAKAILTGFIVVAVIALMAGTFVMAPLLLLAPESRLRR